MERVLKIQKRAIRCITGNKKWELVNGHFQPPSCRNLFKKAKILTAPSCYILEAICYFIKNGEGRLVGEVSQCNTRQAKEYYIPGTRLKKSEQNVKRCGASFYNLLPNEIKEKKGQKNFKRLVQDFLIDHTFYSLAEYRNFFRAP